MVGGWAESVGVRVRASGLRHEAGAAQHASAPLSTLSERSAPSDTLRNARPSPQATRRCGCHRTPLDQALTHPQIVRAAAHVRGCWCRLLEWLPDVRAHAARCRRTRCGRVLGHHIRDGSWTWVRPRARVATAAAACGSRSPAAACGIRAYVGGAMRVRRTAGAAQHASQTLSTLSERTARSHAQRRASACHTFSTTTLAHRQRHGARWMVR